MRETQQYVVMHYGEVSIKGEIARYFCAAWSGTCSRAGGLGDITVEMLSGRLLVAVPIEVPWASLEERLRSIFGLANFAAAPRHLHDLEAIKQTDAGPARPHVRQFSYYGASGF